MEALEAGYNMDDLVQSIGEIAHTCRRLARQAEKQKICKSVSIRANLLALLNISQKWSIADLTGACPVKYLSSEIRSPFHRDFAEMERSEFN